MKHIVRVISVTTILLFSLNSSVMSQITSFDRDVKINYLYGELGSAIDGANFKAGYTWSLYEILNTDLSFGIGLRFGEMIHGFTETGDDKSNIGLHPSLGYQIYTENRIFEPHLTFDISSSIGYGVGFNTTFNRFLVGVNFIVSDFDEYFGLRLGYTFPKTIEPSF